MIAAAHAVIACRAGQPCLTHRQLAVAIGCSLSSLRLALYKLHTAGSLQVGQLAGDAGCRIRMRVRLAHGWSDWTSWSRRVSYSFTGRAMVRPAIANAA